MPQFGITATGFVPKRVADIVEELNAAYRAEFGPEINLSPDGFLGRQIQAQAQALGLAWDGLAQVYASMARGTAEGVSLDNVGDLVGIKRKPAVASVAPVVVTGTPGQSLPTNFTVSADAPSAVGFQVTEAKVLASGGTLALALSGTPARTTGATFTVGTVVNNVDYTVQIAGHTYTFPSDGTAAGIRAGLVAAINATQTIATVNALGNEIFIAGNVTAALSGLTQMRLLTSGDAYIQTAEVSIIQLVSGNTRVAFVDSLDPAVVVGGKVAGGMGAGQAGSTVVLTMIDRTRAMPIVLDAKLTAGLVDNVFSCGALVTGPIAAPANTLTLQVTVIPNVDSVTNPVDATLGRNRETDAEYRTRQLLELTLGGTSTDDAIRADILNITLVTGCSVTSNRTDYTDGAGRPPHSFEAVVEGGSNQDVGNTLWATMPAGIESFGSNVGGTRVEVEVLDSQNRTHLVAFTRPASLFINMAVTVTATDPEVPLPANAATLIREAVLTYGNALAVGRDVVCVQFIPAIIAACPGIAGLTVLAALNPASPSLGVVTVGPRSKPAFIAANVTVTV